MLTCTIYLNLATGTVTVSGQVPYYFLFWINEQKRSKEVSVCALGWGLCPWLAALVVRVPLSIGTSDLVEAWSPIGSRLAAGVDSKMVSHFLGGLLKSLTGIAFAEGFFRHRSVKRNRKILRH